MARFRSILVVAVAASLAVGLPTAARAADLPTAGSAHSDYDADYGTLVVSAASSSGIESIRAHLVSPTAKSHRELFSHRRLMV